MVLMTSTGQISTYRLHLLVFVANFLLYCILVHTLVRHSWTMDPESILGSYSEAHLHKMDQNQIDADAQVDQVCGGFMEQLNALPDSTRWSVLAKICSTLFGTEDQAPVELGQDSGSVKAPMPTFFPAETPRLPIFSRGKVRKGEVSYTQWKYEVLCLEHEQAWPSAVLLLAIRRSLRGMAQDALHNLGMKVTIKQIVKKLDSIFGTVTSPEQLLENFYVSRQSEKESVAQWGTRLEDLAREAQEANTTASAAVRYMLRGKFVSGLCCQHIRNCIRHRFDKGESYDQLLRAARSIEEEQKQDKKLVCQDKATVAKQQVSEQKQNIASQNIVTVAQQQATNQNQPPEADSITPTTVTRIGDTLGEMQVRLQPWILG